jgi:hypothetical protein
MTQPYCPAGSNYLPVRLTLARVLFRALTGRGQELRPAHPELPSAPALSKVQQAMRLVLREPFPDQIVKKHWGA